MVQPLNAQGRSCDTMNNKDDLGSVAGPARPRGSVNKASWWRSRSRPGHLQRDGHKTHNYFFVRSPKVFFCHKFTSSCCALPRPLTPIICGMVRSRRIWKTTVALQFTLLRAWLVPMNTRRRVMFWNRCAMSCNGRVLTFSAASSLR